MKSKIEQQKFYEGKTKKSFASLTNQQQVHELDAHPSRVGRMQSVDPNGATIMTDDRLSQAQTLALWRSLLNGVAALISMGHGDVAINRLQDVRAQMMLAQIFGLPAAEPLPEEGPSAEAPDCYPEPREGDD